MPKSDSSLMMLAVAAVVALGVGYYVPRTFSTRPPVETASTATDGRAKAPDATQPGGTAARAGSAWTASAPGRVEPAGGEVRIGVQSPGRIAEVLVGVSDRLQPGDLILRLDDEDYQAKIVALAAEVAVRRRERDSGEMSTGNLARDRRAAEDSLFAAEWQLYMAREDFDRAFRARAGGVETSELDRLREARVKAEDRVEQARTQLRKALNVDGLPSPSRGEVALTAARAELSAAESALERTRIRAGSAGTVLSLNARVGEVLAPSAELPVAVIGNLGQLRVRAEFEERDLGKVRDGQAAVIRSDAFQGRDFEGKVSMVAPSLSPSRISQRGPRKPNDVDVLEVLVTLTGQTPLLPGMRVDVFLKPDQQSLRSKATAAN
ncbi:MAG: efflux RND transporter periplasmic adaptor subunit [Hyphomicrobiaceae bacterium]|nr:efflux RND transporter periplasmic adaptor subunit [Hyphomicrobiaceae bacterium]